MLLYGILKHSFLAVYHYKLRTFFSILGIALGIASLSIIVASVEGAFKRAYEVVDRFGPDSILIFGGRQEKEGIRNREKTLEIDDVKDLRQNFPYIKLIMPIVIYRGYVSRKGETIRTRIYGVDKNYEEAWSWYLKKGRYFNEREVKNKKYICVIGSYIEEMLFDKNEEPIGKNIFINKISCKVIGVLEPKGTTITGRNLDNRVLLPYTTVMYKINHDSRYISAIRIRFYKGIDMGKAIDEIKAYILFKHHSKEEDFFVLTPTEIISFLVALTGSLILFLGLSSTISLTVGGFVLTNLFLLSVNERINEIGIRRALGGKRKDILIQFITEALIITSIGAVLGFLLGIVGAELLKSLADFPTHFSFTGFVIAFIVSVIVGIISVLSPSLKASRLSPIKAIKR